MYTGMWKECYQSYTDSTFITNVNNKTVMLVGICNDLSQGPTKFNINESTNI
jgi:hypothetical protein